MPNPSTKKRRQPAVEPADDALPPSRDGILIVKVLLIVLAGLFVYAPAFHGTWLWDDDQEITANAALRAPDGLLQFWSGQYGADYFPLKSSIQWLYFQAFETNPTAWHLLNVGLHLLNALLLWRVFARIGIRHAWIGGLIFSVHPILVESVAWVSELKNTLSLPFVLVSMLAWLRWDERGRPSDYIWALVFYCAAILCKTAIVMYPCILILHFWWKNGRLTPRAVLQTAPFFLISAGMGAVTIWYQFQHAIAAEVIPVGGLLSRTATAGMAMVFYLYKSLLPFNLLPIYPRWSVDPPQVWQFFAWPALAAVFIVCWNKRATWGRHALFGLGFFYLALVPVLGFVTMSYMRITWVADHFLYFPIIGLIGLVTATAGAAYDRLSPRYPRVLLGGGIAVFALLVFESHRYAGIFANEEAMWTHTLKRNPNAWQAHSRLGKVLLERNDNDGAFEHITASVRLRPDLAETHNNYGAMLEKKGEVESALNELRTAVRLAPDIQIYKVNLGSLLVRSAKYEEGLTVYEALLENAPDNPVFLCNSGVALYFLGENDKAIAHFERALQINPDLKDAKENLAMALKKRGSPAPPALVEPESSGELSGTGAIRLFGN